MIQKVRPMNYNEWPLISMWISVSDLFEDIDINKFKRNLPHVLKQYTPFKLFAKPEKVDINDQIDIKKTPFGSKDANEQYWWYKANDEWLIQNEKEYLKEVPFEDKREIRCSNKNLMTTSGLLYYIEWSQKGNLFRIELFTSHSLCDGRTIFNCFDVIRSVITEEKCTFEDDPLLDYDVTSYYSLTQEQLNSIPEAWHLEEGRWYPDTGFDDNENICQTVSYCYNNVDKFCHKYKVGVQSIINTCQTRAFKKFYNLPDNTEIIIWCPTDTRHSSFANDPIKRRHFYVNNGGSFIRTKGYGDKLKDIIEGDKAVKEYTKRYDCCLNVINQAKGLLDRLPSVFNKSLIVSNIGSIREFAHPEFALYYLFNKDTYCINMYSFHNDETIYFVYARPRKINSKLLDLMLNELNNIMKFINSMVD
ncbi:hypothetical protein EHI8A_090190 [Entamoeba histolytica HM-1:IMSS-B]|uniref:Uncharacterized protein n=5 Tax=Entamoeba histolytica TaxID=5759 RepID=C4M458_ENTH1|nr:hypothetical protein EHI_030470 [Entamoeba histolytica HM-1:IMSS]EMD49423.1 Hypothetical protein EHI5A_104660 [Entamoeba histolytica KU27]EMH75194.1 hypothetical protein EHI8A_090190 [Entamoeba histolytica HM-1:IMSS-B]ENY63164.1 hypothetical protein EHI7A_103630 [Entamoeba histolytica HM-1:IMSS-A]GAT96137.1 hypothetical protein CL6EHI_030470 [Entamoeba histolytica]EAL44426.1 hypothetical protein EHI_030470 [Entamoeba histolytica HM-1:IMSS]|eukprot:XP_649812.1 hypothetical protein EHI_030470 [Entamoeba histolytica HM-1:IMSS]